MSEDKNTDRELLELAAKAAGLQLADYQDREAKTGLWLARGYENPVTGSRDWNPLEDDGDALRLAVKLRMDVCVQEEFQETWIDHASLEILEQKWEGDEYAATRRVIVRAAASIGKLLP